jgi:hypothetical protein
MWCHYLSLIRKEDIQMKITRKSLIVVAVVLVLAVMVTPVVASPPPIYRLEQIEFDMVFRIPETECTVATHELSTKHFVFGRPMASTNVGIATVSTPDPSIPCIVVQVGEEPLIIEDGDWAGFAVVDVRNPGNGTVIATYAIVPTGQSSLPLPPQVGANAWLTTGGPSLTYEGYAYIYVGLPGQDYLTVPFTAVGHPDTGFFDVQPGPWK